MESMVRDASWGMSRPGNPDFKERIYDLAEDDEDRYFEELKLGPEKNGIPEYADVKWANIDYDNNRCCWYYSYGRYFSDGRLKWLSKEEYEAA